jgi:DNA primase
MNYASIEEAMVYGYGVERSFQCHVHGDHNPSASVNSVTGLWFCYACGAKGKYNVADIPPDKAATQLVRYIDRMEQEKRYYSENWLDVYDSQGPGTYWLSRFSANTCADFRLGHDSAGRFATIPVRDLLGRVLGVVRRDLTGEDPAKYRYPPGVTMSELLFNYPDCTGDVLMLTEGATDAIAAVEAGWEDVVATYRNGISRAQTALIHEYQPKTVLVAYDQDKAGEAGYQAVRYHLGPRYKVDRLTWSDYKDLASIPVSDRRDMMKQLADQYR